MKREPEAGSQARLSVELLALLDEAGPEGLSPGDLVERLKGRVYPLLLVFLAIPFCQPIVLPGVSTPFGVVIAILGLRFGLRQKPWMPRRLREARISGKFLPAVLRAGAKLLRGLERFLHPRMVWVFGLRVTRLVSGAVIVCCGLLLVLPVPVPLSNFFPALAVVLIALAFAERDGRMLVAGGVAFLLTLLYFGALAIGGMELVTWFWEWVRGGLGVGVNPS